jgi:glutamyl-tRNA synthetase
MHIGTARTALFNWLYARGRGGKFLLRIEDTDRARSTPEATQAILDGMRWLGLDWDGEAVSQFACQDRHAEVANAMLDAGTAYKCFSTQDEIEAFREEARAKGGSTLFRSPWRDAAPETHPDAPFAIRVKAPSDGTTVIRDAVQGDVTIQNGELDDMIVLRSDGSPTYMLAVVVDDHDMGVTHVIRGDDHLNNAARQMLVYAAMGWEVPVWAHIPLIHGEDGKKLSKRHGSLGVMEWAAEGIPAPAMRNYLARLGWSHGDDETFTTAQMREWFDLAGVKKSPARLDRKKLDKIASWHLREMSDDDVAEGLLAYFAATGTAEPSKPYTDALQRAIPALKGNAKNYADLIEKARFILTERPISMDERAAASLDETGKTMLAELTPQLQNDSWSRETLEGIFDAFVTDRGVKFGTLAAPLRAALAGRANSPSVYDMMLLLGREETIARLRDTVEN